MRRAGGMCLGLALMAGSAAAGWAPGSSAAWALPFTAGLIAFAACWASLIGAGHRSARRRVTMRAWDTGTRSGIIGASGARKSREGG